MKRTLAILLALAVLLGSLAAATAENAMPDQQAGDPTESLQTLVDQGIISEETLEAILKYMEENRPTQPDGQPGGESQNGNAPEKPSGGNQNGNAPEMPSGGNQNGSAPEMPSVDQNGNAPEMPSGDQNGNAPGMPSGDQNGNAPGMPNGNDQNGQSQGGLMIPQDMLEGLLNDGIITQSEYDAIAELVDSAPTMDGQGGFGGNAPAGGPGGASQSVTYTANTEIQSATELSSGEYISETADENAILIDTDESVTLSDVSVSKTGDSDGGDNCNFYGLNAAVLAKGGANVTITGGTITTDASGANGVFSYGGNGGQNGADGDGTTVTISDTVITTTGDGSGGIMTTGGGTTYASNLTIETSGRSSAAIRTDRGGGTVVVKGGSYTTNGLGSPAIYSTADITVSDATLVSNLSEGVCIEGKNSIALTNCDLTADNTQCNGNATFLDTIMIYQSMSGDADTGTSSFTMTGGSLTSKSGHVFHVTNTQAIITLSGVEIVNEDADNVLLSVCDDGWNGGNNHAELNASTQALSGAILVGSNSTLSLTLSDGSDFTGSISGEIVNSKGETVSTEVGEVSVTLDETSTWTLTADSYVTSFTGSADQIVSNGYTLYVNGEALEGTQA